MPARSGWRRIVSLFLGLLAFVPMLQAGELVQDFFLPMPEAQINQANSAIISGTGPTINSIFSIVVTGDGTVIYYDQWEDGYETDLSHPAQSTTQIWGDGNNANGIPPGFANDPVGLPAGTVITLTNAVTLPRNPSTILWDARDHVAATKALVISRAAWPLPTGPVFAGAVGVLSTMDYGTNYISPVGQDMTNNLFKYVGMFVMAAQNNTAVTIDPNGNGVGTTTVVLNQGESYLDRKSVV
jgi:large repetitive protein